MAKITNELQDRREEFLRKLFRENPALSQEKANNALKQETGMKMRPHRIYEIRREVREQIGYADQQPHKPQPMRAAARGSKQVELVQLTGSATDLFKSLQKAGLISGRIEHTGEGYAVVSKA